MRQYYVLAADPNRFDLQSVASYNIEDSILLLLWHGQRYQGPMPQQTHLYVTNKSKTDLLGNPLCLTIMSERVASVVRAFVAQDDAQIIDIPVVNIETNQVISDYRVVNCLRAIHALSPRCAAGPKIPDQLEIQRGSVPPDVHLFRLAERPLFLLVSDELLQALAALEPQGITPIPTHISSELR